VRSLLADHRWNLYPRPAYPRGRVALGSAAAIVSLLGAGCGGPGELTEPPPPPPRIQANVTGAAATALGAGGEFVLPEPQRPDELTGQQARTIAEAWGRTHGPMIQESLEREHGAAINFAGLRACGRALYAESPFEPLDQSVHKSLDNHFGSKWLIGLCNRHGRLAVSLAVAARATQLRVEDGKLHVAHSAGNEFFAMGVPSDWDSPVGLSPERAVAQAAVSGRRVVAVPRLIAASPAEAYPQGALWLLELDGDARLRESGTGRERVTPAVYLGVGARVGTSPARAGSEAHVPSDAQPEGVTASYEQPSPGTSATGATPAPSTVTVTARRRLEMPIRFERATIERGT
jgi:hypothetical protein